MACVEFFQELILATGRAYRAAHAGSSDCDRGGDHLREWLSYPRSARGVCGALQAIAQANTARHSRRRDCWSPSKEPSWCSNNY